MRCKIWRVKNKFVFFFFVYINKSGIAFAELLKISVNPIM